MNMALAEQKIYTMEDIYNLPDGQRAELIDGKLYNMAPPTRQHQQIILYLARKISDYIDEKKGSCEVDLAPFAVFLNEDNRNYVEPDICNGVQREHNKKLNNGLPILHKVPPKRDYGRYFCIMAEKGGTSHGGLTEKLSPFFHAKKQEVNAYGR